MDEEIKKNCYMDILVKYQREKGISQGEWAKRSGVSQPQISRYKKGKAVPSIDTISRLANALDLRLCFMKA